CHTPPSPPIAAESCQEGEPGNGSFTISCFEPSPRASVQQCAFMQLYSGRDGCNSSQALEELAVACGSCYFPSNASDDAWKVVCNDSTQEVALLGPCNADCEACAAASAATLALLNCSSQMRLPFNASAFLTGIGACQAAAILGYPNRMCSGGTNQAAVFAQ